MSWEEEGEAAYQQGSNVVDMHEAPRFGHSDKISKLASSDVDENYDYIYGVASFSSFIFFFVLLWVVVLIILRMLGTERVGCAAGRVVQKDRKKDSRKVAREREGRIQVVFLLCGICVLISCGIILGLALPVTQHAVSAISSLNADAKVLIYEGVTVSDSLSRIEGNLEDTKVHSLLNTSQLCPGAGSSYLLNETGIIDAVDDIQAAFAEMRIYLNRENLNDASADLREVLTISDDVDSFVGWITEKDWQPKMFVLFLSIFTVFMIIGAWCSRNNKSTEPLRCMLAYLITPAFVFVLFGGLVATCGIAAVTIMNADFCSGGDYPGSPEGTVMEILGEQGFVHGDKVYDSFAYYQNSCLGESPFDFLSDYQSKVSGAIVSSAAFLTRATDLGVDVISLECGSNSETIIENIRQLGQSLDVISDSIRRSLSMVKCNRVGPIFRQVFHGSTCAESVYGLSCMFAAYFAICIFGMSMVSLRAAMYRRLVPEKRREGNTDIGDDVQNGEERGETSSDDEVDEWNEYKTFMSRFYETDKWKETPSQKPSPGKCADGIRPAGTFDTEILSPVSTDSSDVPAFCDGFVDNELVPLSPSLEDPYPPITRSPENQGLTGYIAAQKTTLKLFHEDAIPWPRG